MSVYKYAENADKYTKAQFDALLYKGVSNINFGITGGNPYPQKIFNTLANNRQKVIEELDEIDLTQSGYFYKNKSYDIAIKAYSDDGTTYDSSNTLKTSYDYWNQQLIVRLPIIIANSCVNSLKIDITIKDADIFIINTLLQTDQSSLVNPFTANYITEGSSIEKVDILRYVASSDDETKEINIELESTFVGSTRDYNIDTDLVLRMI